MAPARSVYGLSMVMLRLLSVLFLLAALGSTPARAEDDGVPYWASIDADVANMRVGPDDSYKINWIYRRPHLPVKVVRREGPWRLIQDPAGDRGWMRDLLLSRQRTAIVTGKGLAEMHRQPGPTGSLLWKLEPGVVGLLGECESGWCRFEVGGHKGFAPAERLWGTGTP